MAPPFKADESQTDVTLSKMCKAPYLEEVETTMWIAAVTWPDLSFTVQNVAKSGDNSGPAHLETITRTLHYP